MDRVVHTKDFSGLGGYVHPKPACVIPPGCEQRAHAITPRCSWVVNHFLALQVDRGGRKASLCTDGGLALGDSYPSELEAGFQPGRVGVSISVTSGILLVLQRDFGDGRPCTCCDWPKIAHRRGHLPARLAFFAYSLLPFLAVAVPILYCFA